jgi:pimeloyl-ACP methyl ester carboxylesterase
MGSRLRQHSRVPGALQTTSSHLWLPESHRLLARSAVTSGVLGGFYRAWVRSLNPKGGDRWAIVEPDRANWGVKGVACILKAGRECVTAAKVFWDMVVQLEKAGYRAGNNLFGVPYDWRLPPTENKLCADLATVLHHMTNATGHRKALLVGHSLGNLQLLHCLNNVFGRETLSKVKALVAIAAPLAGSPQVRGDFSSHTGGRSRRCGRSLGGCNPPARVKPTARSQPAAPCYAASSVSRTSYSHPLPCYTAARVFPNPLPAAGETRASQEPPGRLCACSSLVPRWSLA